MLTYLVRPRGLYREPETGLLEFPGMVQLEFRLEPGGPFGEDVPPLRTVPLGAKVRLEWNACRGETAVRTDARLPRLELCLDRSDGRITFDGSLVKLTTEVRSREELERVIEMYFYGLPPLLGVEMLDSPVITEVRGSMGEVTFCWGLLDSGPDSLDATTKEIQEERVQRALSRLQLLDERHGLANRRLLAATQYFHIACRLLRAPGRRWEFLSEALLNFAKVLEALFPAPPKETIDTARSALARLGFTAIEVEAMYVPALMLRNAVDVAHPTLAAHTNESLAVLARYTGAAEDAFRRLLHRLFERVADGTFALDAPPDTKLSADTRRVITRLKENLERYKANDSDAV